MEKTPLDPMGIGPQYPKDNPFAARMRFHQSWYRANVLKVPFGSGPKPSNTTKFGNMLTRADGERGLNFLSPHIFEVAKRRLAQKKSTIEPFRLFCNLLSSQPMCFNLFGPLVDDVESATHWMQALLPAKIQQVTKVILEYAPEPAKKYLNDRTAFDAYVAYTGPDGQPGFVGIETKLTEAFSARVYSSPFYDRWLSNPMAPWPEGVRSKLQAIEVNQLWRDHLLAVAMKLAPNSRHKSGQFMLVYHPQDVACIAALEVYKTYLKPEDDSFLSLPLDHLVELWRSAVRSPSQIQWIEDFSLRYLDLAASEAEFMAAKKL